MQGTARGGLGAGYSQNLSKALNLCPTIQQGLGAARCFWGQAAAGPGGCSGAGAGAGFVLRGELGLDQAQGICRDELISALVPRVSLLAELCLHPSLCQLPSWSGRS